MTEFNEEKAYDEEIYPLMEKIIEVCDRRGIPMAASFHYGTDAKGPMYCSTSRPGKEGRWEGTLIQKLADLIRTGFIPILAKGD